VSPSLSETKTMSEEEETDDHYLAYRKSCPLVRINILVPMSSRASSLGDDSRVTMGQANNASHTDRRDGSGSVCVNRGASHRLNKVGSANFRNVNQSPY
jgi:hypothetical protein